MHNPFDLSYKGISKHFSVSCTNQGLAGGLKMFLVWILDEN